MPPKPAKLPPFIAPQVPVLSAEPPTGSGWIHEIKHDGFRTLIGISGKDARAFTRSGLDWSDKYQRVLQASRKLRCRSALIDGEIIVQDKEASLTFLPCAPRLIGSRTITGIRDRQNQLFLVALIPSGDNSSKQAVE